MKLPENVQYILKTLSHKGYSAYVVGGCVRDSLMGQTPQDWDIATSALPQQTMEAFSGENIVPTGLKHGTVTLVLNHIPYEITTFRSDGEYKDNRRPENVSFVTSVENDLLRRDFTINAIAYSPETGYIDLFDGKEDIKSGIISCVGDAHTRFNEDALRIMRALRFAATLGFEIEPETEKSILKNKGLLKNIARERINTEFTKLLSGKNAEKILKKYVDVFGEIFPPFSREDFLAGAARVSYESLPVYRIGAFFIYTFKSADRVKNALRSLKFDNKTTLFVCSIAENINISPPNSMEQCLKLMHHMGKEGALALACIRRQHHFKELVEEATLKGLCYSLKTLKISGKDLISHGITGMDIGKALEMLLMAVMEGKTENETHALISYGKKTGIIK